MAFFIPVDNVHVVYAKHKNKYLINGKWGSQSGVIELRPQTGLQNAYVLDSKDHLGC